MHPSTFFSWRISSQLLRTAKNAQACQGASLLAWIIVQEADGLVFHVGIRAAFAHDHLSAVARAVNQHPHFLFTGPRDGETKQAKESRLPATPRNSSTPYVIKSDARKAGEAIEKNQPRHRKQPWRQVTPLAMRTRSSRPV